MIIWSKWGLSCFVCQRYVVLSISLLRSSSVVFDHLRPSSIIFDPLHNILRAPLTARTMGFGMLEMVTTHPASLWTLASRRFRGRLFEPWVVNPPAVKNWENWVDIDFFVGLFCPKMPQISQKDSKHLGDPVFTQVVFWAHWGTWA